MTPTDTSDDTPPCDDLPVRSRNITPGMARDRLVLHNDENLCPAGRRIENPRIALLGAEVAPRPELKKLCDSCDWPEGADAALRRTVRRHRTT